MRAELELQNDLTVATSADDPDVLADLLEETLLASNKIERARKLAPVIMARLAALSAAKTIGATDAWARATATVQPIQEAASLKAGTTARRRCSSGAS